MRRCHNRIPVFPPLLVFRRRRNVPHAVRPARFGVFLISASCAPRLWPKQPTATTPVLEAESKTMIHPARSIAKASMLLLAVLLPVQPLLAACCCDVSKQGEKAPCCCDASARGGAAPSRPVCCDNEGRMDTCCCAGRTDCGTVGSPVSESTADSSCPGSAGRLAAPAGARATCCQTAPLHPATRPLRAASARRICVVLCCYRL